MIYEDIYDFLLRKTSSKEIDILLELVNNVDWGSIVRVDEYKLANDTGTTVRYVKEVLKKFSSNLRGKKVLKKVGNNTYIMLKGKSTVLHRKSDTYCKKFNFLYEHNFKELSIYGKRILLEAAMSSSLTGQGKAYLNVGKFIYRNSLSSGLIPSRAIMERELNNINKIYGKELNVSLVSVITERTEYIYVEMDERNLEEVQHNHAERDYLRNTLFKEGYAEYLEDDYCIEIEKVGKYIFNYLVNDSKDKMEDYIGDFTREMMDVARDIYAASIKRVAKQLHKLIRKGESAKAVSAYFSSIVFSVIMKEIAINKNKKSVNEKVLDKFEGVIRDQEHKKRIGNIDMYIEILDGWCFKWISSRFKKDERNWERNKRNIDNNNELKDYVSSTLGNVGEEIELYGNKSSQVLVNWLDNFKEWVSDFIDIRNEQMESPV